MSPDGIFWLAIAGLIVTCFAAVGARSLTEFSPHDLGEVCRRRNLPDRLGEILRRHVPVALAAETLQVIGTAVFAGAGTFWLWSEARAAAGSDALIIGSGLFGGAFCLLAVEIWIPWAIARLWAEPFLVATWPLWLAVSIVMTPPVLAARFVDTVLHRLAGRSHEEPDEESFEDDIRTLVTEGHREGLLEEDAREMIEGVIELSDVHVSEIMTPRTDMVSMPTSLSWQEALEFITQTGHTRIPVTERNRDDIVGMLVSKDLLPELAKDPDEPRAPWTSLLREPYFIPETKPVDVLLQEFQQNHVHLAIVLDEYGGVSGLVTLEDILEEIVGEIVDEFDKDLVEDIRMLGDGHCEALGKVHIDEINERLGLDLPDDGDFDTIGGFVFSALGRIPSVGEELVAKDVRITVTEATPRRIERVRLEVLNGNSQATA